MDRTLDKHEQDKVRAARDSFFQVQKRKISTGKEIPENTTSTTSNTQPGKVSSPKKLKFSSIVPTKPTGTAQDAAHRPLL
jgi:hypothetical protein